MNIPVINSMRIGDNTVNFVYDSMSTGVYSQKGISSYTAEKSLRDNTLMLNYGNGKTARYSYGMLGQQNTNKPASENIGENYSVPKGELASNSEKKFMKSDEFILAGEKYYNSYSNYDIINPVISSAINKFGIKGNKGKPYQLENVDLSKLKAKLETNEKGVSERENIPRVISDQLAKYVINTTVNDFINQIAEKPSVYGKGDICELNYNFDDFSFFKDKSIYDYYSGERQKYVPKTYYAVNKNDSEEIYTIPEDTKQNHDTIKNINFNGGNLISYNKENENSTYTFGEEGNINATGKGTSTYGGNSIFHSDFSDLSDGILKKTGKLFSDLKINSLINRFHTKDTSFKDDDLVSSYTEGIGMSRGRNLITKEYDEQKSSNKDTGYEDPYCRVWTARKQYSKLKDRIRPFYDSDGNEMSVRSTQSMYNKGMRPYNGGDRLGNGTVLKDNGYLRISPEHDGSNSSNGSIKSYMFSLENLAWKDVIKTAGLSDEQIGPNEGRIMWFPPYNLTFNESVSVEWNSNKFIGRGEQIYTYTNTDRSGNLSFTLLIDHPAIINKWRGTSDEINEKEKKQRDILRFFAGCGELDGVDGNNPKKEILKGDANPQNPIPDDGSVKKIAYVVFFPNNCSEYDKILSDDVDGAVEYVKNYEAGTTGQTYSEYSDKRYVDEILKEKNKTNSKDFNLNVNGGGQESEKIIKSTLFGSEDIDIDIRYLNAENGLSKIGLEKDGKIFGFPTIDYEVKKIEFKGFASSHGYNANNLELCERRMNFMKGAIDLYFGNEYEKKELDGQIINVTDVNNDEDINTISAKIARAAYALFYIGQKDGVTPSDSPSEESALTISIGNPNLEANEKQQVEAESKNEYDSAEEAENEELYRYDNEYLYFSGLKRDDIEYKNIVDKVKYFTPAFHSITPEGFNSRLVFLHQCTRQGPTNSVASGLVDKNSNDYLKYAGNLSFGRAPYCILRIGDFFNTKICITSLQITYDNNGIQWDLNPEGCGVQPMFAKVDIGFNFIGGQDISGPIQRLQNAVSSNYYANTSIYSKHADNAINCYNPWNMM